VAVAASPGESVEAGAELLRIADFSELFADVRVPFDEPAPKGKAFVSIPVTAEQRVLEADVVGPAPDADRAVRLVRLRVRDPENRLRPGLAIEARIAGNAPVRPGFRVPSAALLRYASRTWVFVESESGHYVRRAVAFARSRGGEAFVTEGVRAEEKVVSVGAMTLLSQEQLSAGGGEGE
jgi:hypothetical protein